MSRTGQNSARQKLNSPTSQELNILTWNVFTHLLCSNLLFKLVEFLFFKSSSEGAETILQAVLEDKENITEGGFYKDCKLAVEENDLYDSMSETGKHLWQLSRDITGLKN